MTEAEWLAAAHPNPMLSFLWMKGDERKPRLLAVACFRRAVAHECAKAFEEPDEQLIDLTKRIDFAERIADGLAVAPDEREHRLELHSSILPGASSPLEWAAHNIADPSAWDAMSGVMLALADEWSDAEAVHGAALVRDVYGNPFCPVALDSSWLASSVVALAEGIYQERAFDRMPILADALQDAGCDNADILNHCRGEGPHIRGCWVVDLLLGKT
jgi:hypothetical protein